MDPVEGAFLAGARRVLGASKGRKKRTRQTVSVEKTWFINRDPPHIKMCTSRLKWTKKRTACAVPVRTDCTKTTANTTYQARETRVILFTQITRGGMSSSHTSTSAKCHPGLVQIHGAGLVLARPATPSSQGAATKRRRVAGAHSPRPNFRHHPCYIGLGMVEQTTPTSSE